MTRKPVSGLQEMRQRAFEIRQADRAAKRLAELLEMAGRRSDYELIRDLQRRLTADLMEVEHPTDVLG